MSLLFALLSRRKLCTRPCLWKSLVRLASATTLFKNVSCTFLAQKACYLIRDVFDLAQTQELAMRLRISPAGRRHFTAADIHHQQVRAADKQGDDARAAVFSEHSSRSWLPAPWSAGVNITEIEWLSTWPHLCYRFCFQPGAWRKCERTFKEREKDLLSRLHRKNKTHHIVPRAKPHVIKYISWTTTTLQYGVLGRLSAS